MQKWQILAKDFVKEWVEYPFLAMTANANAITKAQCERILRVHSDQARVEAKGQKTKENLQS